MKISSKILIIFGVVTASIVLLLSGLVYFFASQNAYTDFYKRLELRAVLSAKMAFEKHEKNTAAINELRQQFMEKLPAEHEYFLKIDSAGHVINTQLPSLSNDFFGEVMLGKTAFYRDGNRFYAGIYYHQNGVEQIVVTSALNDYGTQFMGNLRNLLLTSFAIKALLLLAIGYIFMRQVLRPVHQLRDSVEDISSRNLHLRLDVKDNKNEIGQLALTFNKMLDRLETSFESQNNFVSNASHELGTPLTAIIGEAELALSRERCVKDYQQSLATILRQAERLDHITKSLLSLAQTGFEGKKIVWEQLRMDELLLHAKATIDLLNPDNKVFIDYSVMPDNEEKLLLKGNAKLLQLALTNIITNACKYSNNQEVQVSLAATDNNIIVFVKDKGIGIPEKDMPYIFDPFFRAGNVGQFKGYGIGLPLARNIINIHNGDIIVHSKENKGTTIQLKFPGLA